MERKTMVRKESYPEGTIIELTSPIDDPYSPKPTGARFRISFVDDMGQLQGSWLPPEKGSLAVIPGEDHFKVLA